MKFNKKLFSGLLVGALAVSSLSFAANETRKLMATYGVNLNVNGSYFTVSDSSMRPFVTQDGRTYVSVAALNSMNIATVSYDKNTRTVTINSNGSSSTVGNAELQAQVNSQAAQIAKLQYENAQLKAELDKKGSTTNSANGDLSKLTSSEKRSLARDLEKEIRNVRANTRFGRSQRFVASAEISSKKVSINLYQDTTLSSEDLRIWNNLASGSRTSEDMEYEYEDFFKGELMSAVKSILKDYSGYDVDVIIYSVAEPTTNTTLSEKTEMVSMQYKYEKDRYNVYIYNNVITR